MFKEIKNDLPASIVVFFVALPLCLGIALASGAPLFSGIIAGIVGGVVVGAASGSALGVSGPAAGLAVIVLTAITTTFNGAYETFLLSVVFAGLCQLILGFAKAGFIGYFFPSSVIKGMLAGIGILIIVKQIPHALGLNEARDAITPGATFITVVSLAVLIFWDKVLSHKHKIFQLIQGPIVVVFLGVLFYECFRNGLIGLSLSDQQIVKLPVPESFSAFFSQFTFPNFSALSNPDVYKVGLLMAIVASLETLLSVEATDKLDPEKRITPTNRELKAQGLGNMVSGLLGGLPITQVIVRSSANISFGAKTKLSSVMHGILLLISAMTIAPLLNRIPLSCLASILLVVGYKLAKPSLFKEIWKQGWQQFIPYTVTIVGIVVSDLLKGIAAGMIVSVFFTLRDSFLNSHTIKDVVSKENGRELHQIVLAEEVTFFNKATLLKDLNDIPPNSHVIIDCSKSKSIAYDVVELIQEYQINAKTKNNLVEIIDLNNLIQNTG